jgi:hypothetical protein
MSKFSSMPSAGLELATRYLCWVAFYLSPGCCRRLSQERCVECPVSSRLSPALPRTLDIGLWHCDYPRSHKPGPSGRSQSFRDGPHF